MRREAGEAFDAAEIAAEMDKAVRHVVDQAETAGIDIGNDGEQQRVGFQTYVPQRMSRLCAAYRSAGAARNSRNSRS